MDRMVQNDLPAGSQLAFLTPPISFASWPRKSAWHQVRWHFKMSRGRQRIGDADGPARKYWAGRAGAIDDISHNDRVVTRPETSSRLEARVGVREREQ
jgi:hypothetical protein